MNGRRTAQLAIVAAIFAAVGWAVGQQFTVDPSQPLQVRSDDLPPPALSPDMRRLLLTFDAKQRRAALEALPPAAAREARRLFRRHPLLEGGELFELIDTDYDGLIDQNEFEEAEAFVRVVPPPTTVRPSQRPADLEMLLFLDVLESLDRVPESTEPNAQTP